MPSFPDGRSTVQMPSTATAATRAAPATAKPTDTDAKIEKSARDFEAILLSNWLGQAEESFAKVPGGDDDEDDSATAQFTQMSMQSLGASFAGTGGIGIAKMISAQLHRTAENPRSPAPPGTHDGSSAKPK
jgi:Rod binding domain-containing protein